MSQNKNYFTSKDTLFDITEKYPETIPVFVSNGFPQMGDEALRADFGKMVDVETALMLKKKNVETFVSILNDRISEVREGADATLRNSENEKHEDGLNVVGLLPCPVRLPLLEGYNEFAANLEKSGIHLNTELQAASMGVKWVEENIEGIEDSSKLPDLFISAGFDLFFDKDKIGKFKEQGVFEDLVKWKEVNSDFKEYDITDPRGDYSIISVVPAVFLVNRNELGDRDIPMSWGDILFGDYEGAVSLPVGDFDLFNAILLNIHKKYGDEGVERLGKVMMSAMHPSQMVKSEKKKGIRPVVTIMPYFFTKTVKEGSSMIAVWPEDGAILSPIFMLAKKERADELKNVTDYFASEEVGRTLSNLGLFPSLNPAINNKLGKDKPFMWIGWDYIYDHDLTAEINYCNDLFEKHSS